MDALFQRPIASAIPYRAATPPAAEQVARPAPPSSRREPLPPLPQVGRPEMHYAKLVRDADRRGDVHAHEAAKVGQYVTLAMDPALSWEQKLRYFRHALRRHCTAPPLPDDEIWMFYRQLAGLVRSHCGAEALRLASKEDDVYAVMIGIGRTREEVAELAEQFFINLLGHQQECPEWFDEEDWMQLKLIRDQWM
ncbi:MAG TPA: hypothetical protein VK324_04190 [Tepidisphaeraceae bacterium]|nr:hypothetical protein [Tepidisphaeraceae bacterium]